MGHELLVLTRSWFLNNATKESRANITKLINKAYSLVHFKYECISSCRVTNADTLISDLEMDKCDEFCYYVVLGPTEKFDSWKNEGFSRQFVPTTSLANAYDCNIPQKYAEELQFDASSDIAVVVPPGDFQFDGHTLSRVISACGLKGYNGTNNGTGVKPLTLAAVTSFMRQSAAPTLELVISRCLLDPKILAYLTHDTLETIDTLRIHADVIKEHQLVDFYTKKCHFKQDDKHDISVSTVDECPFEDMMAIKKPFTISFLYRDVSTSHY